MSANSIPDGYTAVPLVEGELRGSIWIGVLVRSEACAEGGGFVLLRILLDARVYLGCLMDAGGRIHQWIEVWVQTVAGLKQSPAAAGGALTNQVLDGRWRAMAEAFQNQERDEGIWTGWELCHPPPLFVSKQAWSILTPKTAAGVAWRLCEDDALLERNGLPPYRAGLDRYLVAESGSEGVRFIPITPGAPGGVATVSFEEAIASGTELLPFNPEGGLMLVRPYCALGLGEYLDVLCGGGWGGISCGRVTIDPFGLVQAIGKPEEPNRTFFEASDMARRHTEIFYLKLSLLADMIQATEAFIAGVKRPLFNLDEHAFRVRVSPQGAAMPCLWTAKASLVCSGDAVQLPLDGVGTRFFVSGRERDLSAYRPMATGYAAAGRCSLRIRRLLPETRQGIVIEGTLQTRDVLTAGPCDLVWLRLPVPAGVVDLYAHLEENGSSARGEWRFRTVEQRVDPARARALQALEGIPIQNIPHETIPMQSTPCDLYGLAVVAIRMLLVNGTNTLSVALDGILSLAQEAEAAGATDETLSAVIAAAFAQDPRWGASMGPQFLAGTEMEMERAFEGVTPALWCDALALIVRMIPGAGSFRTCRHFGDAPDGALHEIMRRSRADVAGLAKRVRSLIAGDSVRDQEMLEIVGALRQTMGQSGV
jgi:hypothetical protein